MIDLRSDTVTQPTEEMRRAMAEAELGDDVYGEDPSVNRLQELAAHILGKEDALLVTSGTQGNQVSILAHCCPGSEVIIEEEGHIFFYEAGAASALAGVQFRTIKGERGSPGTSLVKEAIREENIHFPPTSLICLENTHNRAGGAVIPLEKMEALYKVAQDHAIPVHLDGARLFNAAVASGVPARSIAAFADTVQVCLSKGLAAPVGSIIAGSREWIAKARRWRKRLGGGMRQAGIIAAPGIVALETMVERLAQDHANAAFLAERLAGIAGIEVNPELVDTNIVMAGLKKMAAAEFCQALRKRGVLLNSVSTRQVRFVTHKDVSQADIEKTLQEISVILK